MAKTVPQIVKELKSGAGTGGVFTAAQVKPYLDSQLQQAANAFKEVIIALIESTGKHKIRRDGDGLFKNLVSTFTTDGASLSIPEYAEAIDKGRAPGIKRIPLDALVKWLKRYRVLSRVAKTGRFQKVGEDAINQAAYAIQTAVFKHGIKARPWIEQAQELQAELVKQLVEEVVFPAVVNTINLTRK